MNRWKLQKPGFHRPGREQAYRRVDSFFFFTALAYSFSSPVSSLPVRLGPPRGAFKVCPCPV